MKKLVVFSTILCFLTVIGTLPAVLAVNSTPLKGSLSGTGVATSQTTNSITARIQLTHLGNSSLDGTTIVTGRSDCGGFVGKEIDTITAPNGDKIFLSGNGRSCPVSITPLVFNDTVTFSVTGGTGRFSNASGSGVTQTTLTITLPSGASTFTATIDGTINY